MFLLFVIIVIGVGVFFIFGLVISYFGFFDLDVV